MGARPGSNNNGGPKTPKGRARALANLDRLAAVKHGIYLRRQAPQCDECEWAAKCSGYKPGGTCDPQDVIAATVAEVMAAAHIREDEGPHVGLYARLLLRWQMPWLFPGKYQLRSPRGLLPLMDKLGLTPLGRAKRRAREWRCVEEAEGEERKTFRNDFFERWG